MQGVSENTTVAVWDRFVRFFHWSIAAGFFVAYLTEGEPLLLHIWAGYVISSLVIMRIVWGFIGPQHARFSDFVFPLRRVFSYLRDELSFRAKRHIGHSPAGGAMILALLAGLLLTTSSGATLLALSKGSGPFSAFIARAEIPASQIEGREGHKAESPAVEAAEEVHEVLANLCLVLVILHITGVVLASVAHKENLAASMIHGRKRADAPHRSA